MPLSRLFLPLFLAFALLSAQQGAAAHALSHALEQAQQQDKQAPHSPACEQCAAYAQLGSALTVGAYHLALTAATSAAVSPRAFSLCSTHILGAAARGPPHLLQKIA